MCAMAKIATCQLTFTPIVSEDYIADIKHVIEQIKQYELECEVGHLSTTIRGERDKILQMIVEVYTVMDRQCHFTMDIKLSNICGCQS